MDPKQSYLTPRQMFSYLRTLESKLPPRKFAKYQPVTKNENLVTETLLNEEAAAMLAFLGLVGYTPDVKLVECEEGTAGSVSLNSNSDSVIHINVSLEFRHNWRAAIATLAHEVCHKLLFVNGIYNPLTIINEIYCDLSTIYVGFGQVILNGYVTQSLDKTITHTLGYLDYSNYKVVNEVMDVVYGDAPGLPEYDDYSDCFTGEVLIKWCESDDKQRLLKKTFVERESQIARLRSGMMLMQQIFDNVKASMVHELETLDRQWYKDIVIRDGEIVNKMTAISYLYEMNLYEPSAEHVELTETIYNSLYDLYVTYQKYHHIDFRYNYKCPFCGTESKLEKTDRRLVVTCGHCGRRTLFDARHWNCSGGQRQQRLKEQKLREELQREYDAAKQQMKADMIALRNELEHKKAEIVDKSRDEGYEECRRRLPFFVRWWCDEKR